MAIWEHWTVDNYLTLITIVLMIISGIWALLTWGSAIKIKRTNFLNEILNKLLFDQDMAKAVYTIDYGYDWYTVNFHNNDNSTLEFQMDKLLSYLDFVCYLHNMKHISDKEFIIVEYKIISICSSPSAQAYLWNLYHFSKHRKTICPYIRIIDYGIERKIIRKEFKANNNNLYKKYLNF